MGAEGDSATDSVKKAAIERKHLERWPAGYGSWNYCNDIVMGDYSLHIMANVESSVSLVSALIRTTTGPRSLGTPCCGSWCLNNSSLKLVLTLFTWSPEAILPLSTPYLTPLVFSFIAAVMSICDVAGLLLVITRPWNIQQQAPQHPKPSKKPMWRGVIVAYIVVALCYFPVSMIGYKIFGNTVEDNILISLERPPMLIAIANLFVVIHVIGSYQICIILGVLLMCLAPIGALRQIILQAKDYKFYS
ncbi:lysine histidine transporter 1-like protein [Tanacetum coccineum]